MAAQLSSCWMVRKSSVTRAIRRCKSSMSSKAILSPIHHLIGSGVRRRCPTGMRFRNSLDYFGPEKVTVSMRAMDELLQKRAERI